MQKFKEFWAKIVEKVKSLFKRSERPVVAVSDPVATPVAVTPVEKPVEAPTAPQAPVTPIIPLSNAEKFGSRGTAIYLGLDPDAPYVGGSTPPVTKPLEQSVDKTTVRNLSGGLGNMGHVHAEAGHIETFYVNEPKDSVVQITTLKINSSWGDCDQAVVSGAGQSEVGKFDAHASISFPASGDVQEVYVQLLKAGGVAVQRN